MDVTKQKETEKRLQKLNKSLEDRIYQVEELQKQLKEQVIRDPLTNLYNRRFLQESIQREISRAKRNNSNLSFIMLDIDYFKKFNDTYGHIAGDLVLQKIAIIITKNIRFEDFACRYGGR